jgi:hypothetical protein
MDDQRCHCLTFHQIFALTVFPWSTPTLTLDPCTVCWSILFRPSHHQLLWGSALIWSSLVSTTAFCQSVKQAYNSLSVSKVCSDIILSVPFASSLVSFPVLNANLSSHMYNLNFLFSSSKYRVSQEECEILRNSVPYVKLYRYNPKHLYPKLNG